MTSTFSTNQSLPIGLLSYKGNIKDTLDITEMIELQPFARDPVHNSYFSCLMVANFLVGLFYRILVFKQIWKTGGLFGRPINLLTGIFEMQIMNMSTSITKGHILVKRLIVNTTKHLCRVF